MKSGRKLNRTSSHREAMFKNMAASLIKHELIRTTLPKAKELRRVAEPLITLAKVDTSPTAASLSRACATRLPSASCSSNSARVTASARAAILRILKCGQRVGDNAPMAYVELVDRPRTDAAAAE